MANERRFTIAWYVVCPNCVSPRFIVACQFSEVDNFLSTMTIVPFVNRRFVFEVQNISRCVVFFVNATVLRFLGFLPSNLRRDSRVVRFPWAFAFDQFGRRYSVGQRKGNEYVVTVVRRALNSIVFTSANFIVRVTTVWGRFVTRGTHDTNVCGTMNVLRTNYRVVNTRGDDLNNVNRAFNTRRTGVAMDGERSSYTAM